MGRFRLLHGCGAAFGLVAVHLFAQADNGRQSTEEAVADLISAVVEGEKTPESDKPDAEMSDRIRLLVTMVDHEGPICSELAMRTLEQFGSKSRPAIPALCEKLKHSEHSVRIAAVDALVAIGQDSVGRLREATGSPMGRTRAAAVDALRRLKQLDLQDVNRLAVDSDPRVRCVAARTLSELGERGVKPLTLLLRDHDLTVAIEATRGLRSNRQDPRASIPALIDALSNKDLGWAAATALAAYGVDARRAIPAIIRQNPQGTMDWDGSGLEPAEFALAHLGPPDEQDVPAFCECLRSEDVLTIIRASRMLERLGIAAQSAAPALESAMEATIRRAKELEHKLKTAPENEPNDQLNPELMYGTAAYVAKAFLRVTRDLDRFLKLIEKTGVCTVMWCDDSHYDVQNSEWQPFTDDEVPLLERMLQSENPGFQFTAVNVLLTNGRLGAQLKESVFEFARSNDSELARRAIWALAVIGPSIACDVEPVLLAMFDEGIVTLPQFASIAVLLELRTPKTQALLERGLNDSDPQTAFPCAEALCKTTRDANRTAEQIIEAVQENRFGDWCAVRLLPFLTSADSVGVPFLREMTSNGNLTIQCQAIEALGKFRHSASPAIETLKKFLEHENSGIQLIAARSIFQITGDASHLKDLFESLDESTQLEIISDLGFSGARFLPVVANALHESDPTFDASPAIMALKAIGTAEAVALLEKQAASNDWARQSSAKAALHELRDSKRKQGR